VRHQFSVSDTYLAQKYGAELPGPVPRQAVPSTYNRHNIDPHKPENLYTNIWGLHDGVTTQKTSTWSYTQNMILTSIFSNMEVKFTLYLTKYYATKTYPVLN